jgi:hypothetical protein
MSQQALESISEAGKLKQGSFIYYVGIASGNPKLKIFDYKTCDKNKKLRMSFQLSALCVVENLRN